MADVSSRARRKRRLRAQQRQENKSFKKYTHSSKYGSREHRKRISQGILRKLYGRPLIGSYRKSGRPKLKRVAGYRQPYKAAVNHYQFRRNKRRPRIFK